MTHYSSGNRKEIFERITRCAEKMLLVFREQGMQKLPEIKLETDIFKDLGIDSVEVMDLIGLIEKEFAVAIEPDKVATKRTFADIVDYVDELLRKS